jgi:hypothetical protein
MAPLHWHLILSDWFVVCDKSVPYWHSVHLLSHTAHSSQEHAYTNRPWLQFDSMLLTHHCNTSPTLICPLARHANHRVSATQQGIQYLHTPCLLLSFVKLLDFGVEGDRVQYRLSDYKRCSRFYSVTICSPNLKAVTWQWNFTWFTKKLYLALLTIHFIMDTDFVMRFPVSGVSLSYLFFS